MSKRQVVKIPFQSLISVAGAASAQVNVSPNATLSPHLAAIADAYDEYRFISLRYRIHPPPAANADAQVLSYYPGIVDTPPATNLNNSESTFASCRGQGSTVPSEWQAVPKATLAGMHVWYKTVPGTPESAEEVQGILAMTGAIGSQYLIEVRGAVEFKAPINTGSTPAERVLAARLREKRRIASLLALESATSSLKLKG